MIPAVVSISHVNRWFIGELIDALLRPMFVRYRQAAQAGDTARAERCELRFLRLLDACDCFPFCVEVTRCGLFILDESSEDYFGEEDWS